MSNENMLTAYNVKTKEKVTQSSKEQYWCQLTMLFF